MKRIVFLAIFLVMVCQVCYASPLNDFTKGATVVNVSTDIHSFEGSKVLDFSVSTGLGNDWAASFRQTGYDTSYDYSAYSVKNRELNILHKLNNNIQLYAGYSTTAGYDKLAGHDLQDKNVLQAGIIANKKLGDKMTLFTMLGGGQNVTNIEFGLSYQLKTGLELTATYRHLSVEKVGPAQAKENLRGFGLGLTFQL